jgi:hypothetical protein
MIVDDTWFPSRLTAAQALGVHSSSLRSWLKTGRAQYADAGRAG